MNKKSFDLIVIGSGAAGMMSAITAARSGKRVLLIEKLSTLGAKLKATGGGRCNLTNTLPLDDFMNDFGKNGRFMTSALKLLDQNALREFFLDLKVETHSPDGFRVFPKTHRSDTIIRALEDEIKRLKVELISDLRVEKITVNDSRVTGVESKSVSFFAPNVIVATGGLGYKSLGGEGDGYLLASKLGHRITSTNPAMLPLVVKESWVAECRSDTIAKVTMRIDLKKYKKLKATGDLIFTKNGIRGPVVLDFSREITPLLEEFKEIPILLNLTKGMNQEQIREALKSKNPIIDEMTKLLPRPISLEFCKLADIDPKLNYKKIDGVKRDKLIEILANTPLTVIDHTGFDRAMITRGGVSLKEVNPDTLESRIIKGLYFCGEVLDLDGPCGGYNLQWSFSSGALAGRLTS